MKEVLEAIENEIQRLQRGPMSNTSMSSRGSLPTARGTRSGLWFEFKKAVCILRPKYILIENVSMLPKRGLNIVLCGLAELGYDAEWFNLCASDFGAPSERKRTFIVAYPTGIGLQRVGCGYGKALCDEKEEVGKGLFAEAYGLLDKCRTYRPRDIGDLRKNTRIPYRIHRIKSIGNAVVPQVAEYIGRMIMKEINHG